MLRVRLLEVYDKDIVDQLIPLKPEHFQKFENDSDNVDLSTKRELAESLVYKPKKTNQVRADKNEVNTEQFKDSITLVGPDSNCFAVHGNFTQKGKPFLACDLQGMKSVNSAFYLTRVTWNETKLEVP